MTIAIGLGILVLAAFFVAIFVTRAVAMKSRLKEVAKALAVQNAPNAHSMRGIFAGDETLSHERWGPNEALDSERLKAWEWLFRYAR